MLLEDLLKLPPDNKLKTQDDIQAGGNWDTEYWRSFPELRQYSYTIFPTFQY